MKKYIILLIPLFLSGCLGLYSDRYQEIDDMYSSGQLSAYEYMQLKQTKQDQEYQAKQNIARALDNTFKRQAQEQEERESEYQRAVREITNNSSQNVHNIFENSKSYGTECSTDIYGKTRCITKKGYY